jgi:O-antigen ligase
VHRIYVLPKLAVLLVGSAALIPLIALRAQDHKNRLLSLFKSKHAIITGLYMTAVLTSTILSGDPTATLFGNFYNQMGLIPRLCFFVCFIALIVGIGSNQTRLETALWAMLCAGLLVSVYALSQFFGYDPFLPSVLYTSDSPEGVVVRVIGTLGHADYLGNFLLYTTPLAAALAIASRGLARLFATLAAALSLIAIAGSGTRGAWVGLVCGTVIFAALILRDRKRIPMRPTGTQLARAALLGFLFILVVSVAMSLSPASRSIVARARLTFTEGFTGAGRINLWRDSIKMVPAFALTGSGPDNFRKAFLPYKSKELGRATVVNSESSHNSYLDAAISFGVPGFLLYVAIITSSFNLLFRAGRRKTDDRM